MNRLARLIALLALAGALSACALPAGQPAEAGKLRVAAIPVTDVLPLYVAQQEGYFEDEGIVVEIVPVASGPERETLVQAGGADGEMNEILANVLNNARSDIKLKAISIARRPFPDTPLFFVLSSPASGITAVEQLKGVEIGIGENTVIEYVTDRLLQHAGFAPDEIRFTNVAKIPVRLELLMSNQIQAGTMPDPLSSLARLGGAQVVIADNEYPEVSHSVLSFREDVIEAQPNTVRGFLRAWDRAVESINTEPAKFRNVLIETARVPEALQDQYELPPFPDKELPTEGQVQDVVDWALEKGLIDAELSYEQIVDPSFRR